MTTKAHKLLSGADLHEPKGIETATSGQVYQADGIGSGSWVTLDIPTGLFLLSYASFTSSGTWTKPADFLFAEVIVIGGGLGSGGDGGNSSFGAHVAASGATAADGGVGTTGTLLLRGLHDAGGALVPAALPLGTYGSGVGGGGGAAIKVLTDADLAATVAVTIGAGGTSGGKAGFCLVKQYCSA